MSMAEGSMVPAQARNCRSDCKTCPDLKIHEGAFANLLFHA